MIGMWILLAHILGDYLLQNDWMAAKKVKNNFACAVHCILYTAAFVCVMLPFYDVSWWVFAVIGLTHFPIDRYRLAGKLMKLTGQQNFASHPFAPWSVIIVDNTIHLFIAAVAIHFDLLEVITLRHLVVFLPSLLLLGIIVSVNWRQWRERLSRNSRLVRLPENV